MINPHLLIFSNAEDPHVHEVLKYISEETQVLIVDFSKFSKEYCASVLNLKDISLQFASGAEISFASVECIWWRRPQPLSCETYSDQNGICYRRK